MCRFLAIMVLLFFLTGCQSSEEKNNRHSSGKFEPAANAVWAIDGRFEDIHQHKVIEIIITLPGGGVKLEDLQRELTVLARKEIDQMVDAIQQSLPEESYVPVEEGGRIWLVFDNNIGIYFTLYYFDEPGKLPLTILIDQAGKVRSSVQLAAIWKGIVEFAYKNYGSDLPEGGIVITDEQTQRLLTNNQIQLHEPSE